MVEPTDKQRGYLASLVRKCKNHQFMADLDAVAEEQFGFEYFAQAPMTKRLCSCLIDIFTGQADFGLYVWAVRKDREEMAA